MRVGDNHFANIIHFLTIGMAPEGYTSQQKKKLVVRPMDFLVITGHFYKMGSEEILRRYVLDFERNSVLDEPHGGDMGDHYAGKATMQKILCTCLWWLTLHKAYKAYCRACDACQGTGRPSRMDELPLNLQVSLQHFDKWAIYFLGPIQPLGKKMGPRYIITGTKYLTRWVEA